MESFVSQTPAERPYPTLSEILHLPSLEVIPRSLGMVSAFAVSFQWFGIHLGAENLGLQLLKRRFFKASGTESPLAN